MTWYGKIEQTYVFTKEHEHFLWKNSVSVILNQIVIKVLHENITAPAQIIDQYRKNQNDSKVGEQII